MHLTTSTQTQRARDIRLSRILDAVTVVVGSLILAFLLAIGLIALFGPDDSDAATCDSPTFTYSLTQQRFTCRPLHHPRNTAYASLRPR